MVRQDALAVKFNQWKARLPEMLEDIKQRFVHKYNVCASWLRRDISTLLRRLGLLSGDEDMIVEITAQSQRHARQLNRMSTLPQKVFDSEHLVVGSPLHLHLYGLDPKHHNLQPRRAILNDRDRLKSLLGECRPDSSIRYRKEKIRV